MLVEVGTGNWLESYGGRVRGFVGGCLLLRVDERVFLLGMNGVRRKRCLEVGMGGLCVVPVCGIREGFPGC